MADWQPPASDKPVSSAAPAWTPPATDKPSTPLQASGKISAVIPEPVVSAGASLASAGATSTGPSLPQRIAADVMRSGSEWLGDISDRSTQAMQEFTPEYRDELLKQHTILGDVGAGVAPLQGAFDYLSSPITGTADYAVGRPVASAADKLSRATGQGGIDIEAAKRNAGAAAGALLPFAAPKKAGDLKSLLERAGDGPETRATELLKTADIDKGAAAQDAAKQAAQSRTAQTLSAARGATTPVTNFTPADLGPNLTGKVNLRRFRSGKAATDSFTREDLEAAGVSAEDIEKLRAKKLGTMASTEGLAPAVTTEEPPAASAAASGGPAPKPGGWTAGPVADEGPLSHEPALTTPRAFEDQLHQLKTMREADAVDAIKRTRALPKEITPALLEKFYRHEETRGPALSAEEQALYDEHIKPLKEEGQTLHTQLEELSGKHMPDVATDEGEQSQFYTPRYVKDRTRSLGQVLEQWRQGIETRFKGGAGGGMRKTVDAQKSRRYWMIEDPASGEKRVRLDLARSERLPVRRQEDQRPCRQARQPGRPEGGRQDPDRRRHGGAGAREHR